MINLANQPVRAYSKDDQLYKVRSSPKRGNYTKFSVKTRKIIIARDGGMCVFCGRPYQSIHHIIFASAGGAGVPSNGVCVCNECHEWAHSGRKGRKWFEHYQYKHLISQEEAK